MGIRFFGISLVFLWNDFLRFSSTVGDLPSILRFSVIFLKLRNVLRLSVLSRSATREATPTVTLSLIII